MFLQRIQLHNWKLYGGVATGLGGSQFHRITGAPGATLPTDVG
jgi:hypothetical protein